jgi:Family of unknown function (DUF5752)
MADPFAVKDCALIAISTGINAQNLRELRDRLESIHPGCIYYHFWGGLLRPFFDEPEFMNDFAAWSWRSLHDRRLAERLALIDPTRFKEIEDLRRWLIEVIEERLDEIDYIPWARTGHQFHFTRSQIVVFDTHARIEFPKELQERIPRMSLGSIFYHFIDARRRTDHGNDDFSQWLLSLGGEYAELAGTIAAIDPYFTTLAALRNELHAVCKTCNLER